MTMLARHFLGLSAIALLASGCVNQQASRSAPKLGTESGCYVATDSARCRFLHDLAGGYPITRGGRG